MISHLHFVQFFNNQFIFNDYIHQSCLIDSGLKIMKYVERYL